MNNILCVPRQALEADERFAPLWETGFRSFPIDVWPDRRNLFEVLADNAVALPRNAETEADTSHLQVIPYTVVVCRNNSNPWALTYGRQGAEARLHAFRSCGFGGHVDVGDETGESLREFWDRSVTMVPGDARVEGFSRFLASEARRELAEELPGLQVRLSYPIGLIYVHDRKETVHKVHLGVLYLAYLDAENPANELIDYQSPECGALQLTSLEVIESSGETYEPWSQRAASVIGVYHRAIVANEDYVNNITTLRVTGSQTPDVAPERDITTLLQQVFDQLGDDFSEGQWYRALEQFKREPEAMIPDVCEVHATVLRLFDLVTKSPQLGIADAARQVGFFRLPHDARVLYLSHVGLRMLGLAYQGFRQDAFTGRNTKDSYQWLFPHAAAVLVQESDEENKLDYAQKTLSQKIRSAVVQAKGFGLSEKRIRTLVDAAAIDGIQV